MYEYPRQTAMERRQRNDVPERELRERLTRAQPEVATVVTIADGAMRGLLDAAKEGAFTTVHADSVRDALRIVRERPVRVVLLSPPMVDRDQLPVVQVLTRNFPTVFTAAIVGEHDLLQGGRLLELGSLGVRHTLDLTNHRGWNKLRTLVTEKCGDTTTLILDAVISALGQATEETMYFFDSLIREAPNVCSARQLLRSLGGSPSTVASRFFRAQLPSPKHYLARTRLLYAAALLGTPGLTNADVAYRLWFSSPQSFGRHVRSVLKITAGEFRKTYPFSRALEAFTTQLISPFQPKFRTLHPLGGEWSKRSRSD